MEQKVQITATRTAKCGGQGWVKIEDVARPWLLPTEYLRAVDWQGIGEEMAKSSPSGETHIIDDVDGILIEWRTT